jgi:tetratricopeptide (TPR) repeat protein
MVCDDKPKNCILRFLFVEESIRNVKLMITCLTFFWVTSTIVNPMPGEINFDDFRQFKISEIEDQIKLIQEDPLDAVEYFNLGLAYMGMGRHRQEINSYLEAIRLDSSYANAHFNLAMAYDLLKDGKVAISHARKAEFLYGKKRKHRQVRKVRRYLNILDEKYGAYRNNYPH